MFTVWKWITAIAITEIIIIIIFGYLSLWDFTDWSDSLDPALFNDYGRSVAQLASMKCVNNSYFTKQTPN